MILILLSAFIFGLRAANPSTDKVTNLPGLNFQKNYDVYSGYLNAGNNFTWKMHYWLIESATNPSTDPILVWFNGGPGCSSFGGAFEELGPFYMGFDGSTLFENKFAWNYRANVLFLESPIGVGFSYDTTNVGYMQANDDQTKNQNYAALADFFTSFPQYSNRSFFLSGESYAGVYIPMLTAALATGIKNGTFPNANFAGSAIGNGYMDVIKLQNSLVLWSAYHGRVSLQEWDFLKNNCTQGAGSVGDMDSYNFMNYLVTNTYLSFDSDKSACGDLILRLTSVPENTDQYNYYQDCFAKEFQFPFEAKGLLKRQISKAKLNRVRAQVPKERFKQQSLPGYFNYDSSDPFWGYACWNDVALAQWANSPDVQKALNIDAAWIAANATWNDCNNPMFYSYNMTYIDQYSAFSTFFRDNTNPAFRFLVYNGDVDTVCNYLGDAWFVKKVSADNNLTSADRKEWWFSGQTAGYTQRYTHATGVTIDLLTVKGAGHFVPSDRPGASRQMITNFINLANAAPDYNSTANVDPYPTNLPLIQTGSPAQQLSSIISLVLAMLSAILLM